MLTFKFKKLGNAIFLSHIDILRMTNRTFRRMGISVNYSQGYNPRPLLNLSQPLPLGIASQAEWATVQTTYKDTDGFVKLYNEYSPYGFESIHAYYTQSRPNIAGKVVASDYYIKNKNIYQKRNEIFEKLEQPYFLTTKTKRGMIQKEISSLILDIQIEKGFMYIKLPFGNNNIRIDNLIMQFNKDFGLDVEYNQIMRDNQYISDNNNLVLVDDYLRGLL